MGRGGYQVDQAGMRTQLAQAESEYEFVSARRALLREVFEEEGNPLGKDQYGVELERNLPRVKDRIYAAFDAYLVELAFVRDALAASAGNYGSAEYWSGATQGDKVSPQMPGGG